ncbi:MAG: lantibiotic immunity ABC transporter MutE/EpiE family permease subunit [Inconstantimicrobium porci]|uniref:lantibiotic immunity ABC transporter MutE/EpiE family permease subunit n=1 Tax=Inconstantimicrobium porci TaxID=2652291 RepID=UPI002A90CB64|nr:lantibiotic immunity ABC transporter MutE/EpiE family permease subunit [Inconstantimicrobium porci]MDY5912930.1 lantibiotic immunity ABC transporter MutE/EpiE family permease subunit [Inconstantimicrobium porci]
MKYLKSEILTTKRTMVNKLVLIAPFCVAFFAVVAGGIASFQYSGLYWWYSFILESVIAILCGLSYQKEQHAGKFYSVRSLPISLEKFEFSKVIVLVEKLLIACLFLALLLSSAYLWAPVAAVYSISKIIIGCCFIILASIWEVPLCFLLMRKIGMLITIIVNSLIGIFTIALIGATSLWFIWPYCWAAKIGEYFMQIAISGTFMKTADINIIGTFVVLMISILLFLVLSVIDSKIFAQYEGGEN